MGVAKPQLDIYRKMMVDSDLDPYSTLYFDDREDNYQAGLTLGFQAVKVPMNHLEELAIWKRLTSQAM